MTRNFFLFFFLLVSVGCFARAPKAGSTTIIIVSSPQKPEPTSPPETPEPPSSEGITPLTKLTFTEAFSWNITGETPLASWSPDKKMLSISSDDPREGGKKFIKVFDLTTGKVSADVTLFGEFEYPQWVNNSMLGFSCSENLCGKEKAGVYLIDGAGGAQKKILSVGANSFATLYPTFPVLTIVVTEQPPYPGRGMMPSPIYSWYQFDPKTQKVSTLANAPIETGDPQDILPLRYCSEYANELFAYSDRGKMTISGQGDETTSQRVFVEAVPFPRYPGDQEGVSPCLFPEVDRIIYYSFDAKTNLGKATLMKVRGYQKPAAYN